MAGLIDNAPEVEEQQSTTIVRSHSYEHINRYNNFPFTCSIITLCLSSICILVLLVCCTLIGCC